MLVEQAIFTSLSRNGTSGYHLVSRSSGISEAEATALAHWSPSHDSLLVDAFNQESVSFHSLPAGRFALSRTCSGAAEYSGRGGRQLYTHSLILGPKQLASSGNQPLAVYRDALALGRFHYQTDPRARLDSVELCDYFSAHDRSHWERVSEEFGFPRLDELTASLVAGRSVQFAYSGDRIALAECILNVIPSEIVRSMSFSTSLSPSSARPFRFILLPPANGG